MTTTEFKGKTILVTGGTGSIGSEIVRQLLKHGAKIVRVLARHEDRHYQLMHEFGAEEKRVRFIVGDIRDKDRLKLAMEGVDIVFHAAALKQVALCEYNPFEAVKTNIIGTQNVIESARELGVKKVIGISTDKVAEPEGILGVSKLMAEKLFLSTYYYKGDKKTQFACVRFGNVLGSRGSILPLLKRQIGGSGVVTVTDPKMTRFVMTIPQAVDLVLRATSLMRGHEIFVLKMPAVLLGDIIHAAIEHFAPMLGKKPKDIQIKNIGRREGEKMHEKLLAEYETEFAAEIEDMYILTPHQKVLSEKYRETYPAKPIRKEDKNYFSEFAPRLSPAELQKLITEADGFHS